MTLKDFSFRKTELGVRWLVWKYSFLSFLTQPRHTFGIQKDPNMKFLQQNFNFQSLMKTGAILLPSMWLKDWLTKVKTSKIVTFCYFSPKMSKNFILPSNMVFLANLAFNFLSGISINSTSWMYTSCKIFVQNIWHKFCLKDHTHITFLGWFPMKYVRGFN